MTDGEAALLRAKVRLDVARLKGDMIGERIALWEIEVMEEGRTMGTTKAPTGCDVSHHNSPGFDFHHAKNVDNLSFVICKVSEADHMADSTWTHNRNAAASAGLVCGGYHFIRPKPDGVTQAHWYLKHLGGLHGLLPPVVDVELDDPERVGVDPEAYCDTLEAYLAEVLKETGHHSVVYSYQSMWSWMGEPKQFGAAGHLQWKADYSHIHPTPLAGWSALTFHQFSDHGSAGGCHGTVDLDRYLGGDLAHLKALVIP